MVNCELYLKLSNVSHTMKMTLPKIITSHRSLNEYASKTNHEQ